MFKVYAKKTDGLMMGYQAVYEFASDAIARADLLSHIGLIALVRKNDQCVYKAKLARAKHESAFPNGFEQLATPTN